MRTITSIQFANRDSKIRMDTSEARTFGKSGEDFRKGSVADTEVVLSFDSVGEGDGGMAIIYNQSAMYVLKVGFATGVYPLLIPPRGSDKLSLAPTTDTLYLLSADNNTVDYVVYFHEA